MIEAALSRTLAGRALAQSGERDRAAAEIERAIAALEACGALPLPRSRPSRSCGSSDTPSTGARPGKADGRASPRSAQRELELARLVVDRKTNPEIAAALFLSQKTVESHLRNIFRKLGVASRVELARAVERADRNGESATDLLSRGRAEPSADVRRRPSISACR